MRACINFGFYPVSIASLPSEIDSGEVATTFEKAESANLLPFTRAGAFLCGVPIFVWVLINTMPIFMGCLFCVGAYYSDFTVQNGLCQLITCGQSCMTIIVVIHS